MMDAVFIFGSIQFTITLVRKVPLSTPVPLRPRGGKDANGARVLPQPFCGAELCGSHAARGGTANLRINTDERGSGLSEDRSGIAGMAEIGKAKAYH
jgi:hypothetical protein